MRHSLRNLDKVKEWYIDALYNKEYIRDKNVRYREVQIHTDIPETRLILQDAQKELGIDLEIGYRENTEALLASSLLTLCKEFAVVDENKRLHLFVFTSAAPELAAEIVENEKGYKSWGNNVFTLSAPTPCPQKSSRSAHEMQYRYLQPFFDTVREIVTSFPPVSYEKTRRIDAAAPKNVVVYHPFDLFLQVRFIDDPKLGTELLEEQDDSKIEQNTETLEILFPISDETKRPEISVLAIKLVTNDFEIINGNEKKLYIPLETRSDVLIFNLVPKRPGSCQLNIFIHQTENILVRQIPYSLNALSEPNSPDQSQLVKCLNLNFESTDNGVTGQNSFWQNLAQSSRKVKKRISSFVKNSRNQDEILSTVKPIIIMISDKTSKEQINAILESLQKGGMDNIAGDVSLGFGGGQNNDETNFVLATIISTISVLSTLDSAPKKSLFKKRFADNSEERPKEQLVKSLTPSDVALILQHYNITLPESKLNELVNALVTVIGELYNRHGQANTEFDA